MEEVALPPSGCVCQGDARGPPSPLLRARPQGFTECSHLLEMRHHRWMWRSPWECQTQLLKGPVF